MIDGIRTDPRRQHATKSTGLTSSKPNRAKSSSHASSTTPWPTHIPPCLGQKGLAAPVATGCGYCQNLLPHELAADEVDAASVHSRQKTNTSVKRELVAAALPVHEVVVRLPRLAELRVGLAGRAAEAFYVNCFVEELFQCFRRGRRRGPFFWRVVVLVARRTTRTRRGPRGRAAVICPA